jgi:NitT/TauT family transport system permease protein
MSDTVVEPDSQLVQASSNRLRRMVTKLIDVGLGTMSLLGGLAIWEAVGRIFDAPWLPPFSGVITALFNIATDEDLRLFSLLLDSLQNLLVGFAIALVAGLFVGALMGRYRLIHEALDPYVYALFVSPTMIFIPIFFAIFGIGGPTRITIIVIYGVFVIIINTATAVRDVDPSLVEMARSYGAKETAIFFGILVPASLPLVFAGVQLGMGRAVKGMINGELFLTLVGLGALSRRFGGRFEADSAMAVALVVLIIALVFNWIVRLLDNRMTHWTD